MKPVTVQVAIISSGKKSESHTFVYTPKGTYTPLAAATTLSTTATPQALLNANGTHNNVVGNGGANGTSNGAAGGVNNSNNSNTSLSSAQGILICL